MFLTQSLRDRQENTKIKDKSSLLIFFASLAALREKQFFLSARKQRFKKEVENCSILIKNGNEKGGISKVKMKRILFCLLAMVVAFVLVTPAHAFLITRGTDTLGNRLIYDDDLDITWYDYTNAVNTWSNQVAWANGLSVTFGTTTFDDWRLPTTVKDTYVFGYDGTTTAGYNITNSEMGHLYYTELGNLGEYDTSGNPQPGWGLNNNFGDFQHLFLDIYWSGTENPDSLNSAWDFFFLNGVQDTNPMVIDLRGLAVRSGDVAAATSVPEPTTVALLGIGLAGMGVYGVRRRRQHG